MSNTRPEHQGPPEIVYNETEAEKYTRNSRIIEIQSQLSERSIELLSLPEDTSRLILDIGCGSGLSGECLTKNNHIWVGIDISNHMLDVAREREVEGELVLGDIGNGLPFRPGMFDGVISISAIQWLCHAYRKDDNPARRLLTFFSSLYGCMSRNAKAVFQLYPEDDKQLEFITQQSMRAGFNGGVIIDYPNSSKAKKIFLFLYTGSAACQMPLPINDENLQNSVTNNSRREKFKNLKGKSIKKSRDWLLEKKERRRRQGREVCSDSKYTGRKRTVKF